MQHAQSIVIKLARLLRIYKLLRVVLDILRLFC